MKQTQINRLQSLADYGWFDDGDSEEVIHMKLSKLMEEIETEEELLYAGHVKEWDFEDASIMILFDHPLCDFGLALRFYWMCQPDYYHRQQEKGKPFQHAEIPTWDIIQKIERRLLAGHYTKRNVSTNPADSVGRPLSDTDKHRPGIRLIPKELKVASEGVSLSFEPNKIWS